MFSGLEGGLLRASRIGQVLTVRQAMATCRGVMTLRLPANEKVPALRVTAPAAVAWPCSVTAHMGVHDALACLQEVRGIGFPWSPKLVLRSNCSCGGTLAATRSLLEWNLGITCNLAGGFGLWMLCTMVPPWCPVLQSVSAFFLHAHHPAHLHRRLVQPVVGLSYGHGTAWH